MGLDRGQGILFKISVFYCQMRDKMILFNFHERFIDGVIAYCVTAAQSRVHSFAFAPPSNINSSGKAHRGDH